MDAKQAIVEHLRKVLPMKRNVNTVGNIRIGKTANSYCITSFFTQLFGYHETYYETYWEHHFSLSIVVPSWSWKGATRFQSDPTPYVIESSQHGTIKRKKVLTKKSKDARKLKCYNYAIIRYSDSFYISSYIASHDNLISPSINWLLG